MKIVIEGTPEEIADALRKLQTAPELQPLHVPYLPCVPYMQPVEPDTIRAPTIRWETISTSA